MGRIVVCVDDSAETDTVSSSADAAIGPATGSPSTVSTSSVFVRVVQPDADVAEAGERLDGVGHQHVGAHQDQVVITAAMPGVRPGSLVSSPTARQASQPQ